MTQPLPPANEKRPCAHGPNAHDIVIRRRIARALLLVCLLSIASCAKTEPPSALRPALDSADVVIIGEQHDDPGHHRIQASIAAELTRRARPVVVAFEMIDETQRPTLDAFLAARPRDAAALGARLDWDRSGWPDWALYRPIADAALAQAHPPAKPLAPANLPPALARDIARNGLNAAGIAPGLREVLRQAETRDGDALAVHAADIAASHCGMLPESALAPFALAQYARDATMAQAVVAAAAANPGARIILIAGNGHARKDVGVPRHLTRLKPGLKVLSIGLLESATPDAPFDHVWRTPALEREDPCAAFAKPMN